MESSVYLARQPILDKTGKLFAFELLFRDSPKKDSAVIRSAIAATANVLENALNGIGLQALLGSHKGFINCNREMLLGNITSLLDAKHFVLEILEDVIPDETIVAAVASLKYKGFEIALDDFVYTEENCRLFSPIFPYLSYIKIDLVNNTLTQRKEAVSYFRKLGISLLAEKVETESTFQECLDEGYDYFQGFFFARPEILTGNFVPAETQAILSLLRLLRKEPTLGLLCKEIENYPEIKESLLRYAVTGNVLRQVENRSIQEIIEWIGIRRLHEWLMLLLYSRSSADSDSRDSALFRNVSHRAKFMENIAAFIPNATENFCADAFLLGVLSRLEALSNVSLDSLISKLNLSDAIKEGLYYRGQLGLILRLTDAMEKDCQEEISDSLTQLSLKSFVLKICVENAYTWAAYA